MGFKLYPDCKLVTGKTRDAIYDLTRNGIYIIPHDMSKCIDDNSNVVYLDKFPSDKRKEYVKFLTENELGRFDMPEEIIALSNEFITPSNISNAIIDIGERDLPLLKISMELSDLVCESVFLRFMNRVPFDYIIACSKNFISQSMSSIELGIQYEADIDDRIYDLMSQIPICSRIVVVNSPFTKTEVSFIGIPIRYTQNGYSCIDDLNTDYSVFSNANLDFYLESLKYNNCLNKKVAIDQYGNIKNCPELTKTFGNISTSVLSEVVESHEFRKLWYMTKDNVKKCCDCELRYACQYCIFAAKMCSYNVYTD